MPHFLTRSLFGLMLVAMASMTMGVRAEHLEPAGTASLREQPITAAPGEAALLLKRLAIRNGVAGNVGDVYDNRDRGHSKPNLKWFPQLQRIVYTEADREANRDWALATQVRPGIIVGNSSTSAGPGRGGSNPRSMFMNRRGLMLGWLQYINSNLYVYPEHRDYDPGPFGLMDRGDAYPVNTPYVVISRGSSGSDRPFLHALFWTLAGFRPEVKEVLHGQKMLMPTLQMILRRSLDDVLSDEDYMSGRAHPTAFDSKRLNPRSMVSLAHSITLEAMPPMAVLEVEEESESRLGRDYFLDTQPERWAETPAVISRIYRGPRPAYRMIVDASGSFDLTGQELDWHWRVLRGDAARIEIRPLNEEGSRVELIVPFHNEAMPAPDDPQVEHRRVDIGCFVSNHDYISPPAFVCFYMPPAQRMTLDEQGRVFEIGYGAVGSTIVPPSEAEQVAAGDGYVTDWPGLLEHFASDEPTARLLREMIGSDAQKKQLQRVAAKARQLDEEAKRRKQQYEEANRAWREHKGLDKERLKEVRDRAKRFQEAAKKAIFELLVRPDDQTGLSACELVLEALNRIRRNPRFYELHQRLLDEIAPIPGSYMQRLRDLRLLVWYEGRWVVTPVRQGDGSIEERLTVFERNQLAGLNDWIIFGLCENLVRPPAQHRADPRLALPHVWRDVYRYDEAGNLQGWTRYGDGEPKRFTADGDLITVMDIHGRPTATAEVEYAPSSDNGWQARLQMDIEE